MHDAFFHFIVTFCVVYTAIMVTYILWRQM